MKVSKKEYLNYLKDISDEYTKDIIKLSYLWITENKKDAFYVSGLASLSQMLMNLSRLRYRSKTLIPYGVFKRCLTSKIIDSDRLIEDILEDNFDGIKRKYFKDIRKIYECITNYVIITCSLNKTYFISIIAYLIDYVIQNKGDLPLPLFDENDNRHDFGLEPTNWEFYTPVGNYGDLPSIEMFDSNWGDLI